MVEIKPDAVEEFMALPYVAPTTPRCDPEDHDYEIVGNTSPSGCVTGTQRCKRCGDYGRVVESDWIL